MTARFATRITLIRPRLTEVRTGFGAVVRTAVRIGSVGVDVGGWGAAGAFDITLLLLLFEFFFPLFPAFPFS